jgi:hypothetical protein
MTTHQHILALTLVDRHYADGLGTEFPTEGVFRSEAYADDDDISHGIWGFEWGRGSDHTSATHGIIWAVKDDENVYNLGNSILKFRRGSVVFAGTLSDCYNFLKKEEQEPSQVYSRSPEESK